MTPAKPLARYSAIERRARERLRFLTTWGDATCASSRRFFIQVGPLR